MRFEPKRGSARLGRGLAAPNTAYNQRGLKMSFSLRRLRMGPLRTRARQKRKRLVQRVVFLEQLEPRIVLDGAPVALPDPFYSTAEDTALTVLLRRVR